MSDFLPYSPPQHPMRPGDSSPDSYLLAPVRRAAVMLIVLGGLTLLFSACTGAGVFGLSKQEYETQFNNNPFIKKYSEPKNLPPGFSLADATRNVYRVTSISGLAIGPVFIILGLAVRRGDKTVTVFTAIFCGLLLTIEICLGVIATLLNNAYMCAGACLGLLPCIMLGVAAGWLMQALRRLPQIAAARAQWQQLHGTAQQQQRVYNQGAQGYGQGVAPEQFPGAGAPPGGSAPIGYGAMPAPPGGQGQASLPVRHPPLPPDQQTPGNSGS